MATPIDVLVAEDHAPDAELMIRELRDSGFDPHWRRVETEEEFVAALESHVDVVLADYHLPRFTGLQALQLVVQRGLDIPMIIVTGTLGDERTADCLKQGAADYVHKDRLKRLGPAVTRALAGVRARREYRIAEVDARTTHAQLRHLLAYSPATLYRLQFQHGRVVPTFVSDNIETLLGFTAAEATAPDWWLERLHADDRHRMTAVAAALWRSGGFNGQYRLRHKNGEYRWVEDHCRALRDASGAPLEAVGVFIDITGRKQLDAALRDSQLRLQLAVEASHIGPWDWDLTTDRVYYSPEWKRQIGYADDEIANGFSEWADRLHPDDRDRTIAAAQAFASDRSGEYDVEFRFRHKDESYRWIQTRAILVRDDNGRPVRMLGCHVDVTDRKQDQIERERLAKTMQLLLDSTGEGIYGVDKDGRCTFINRAAAQNIGWLQSDLVGRTMHELIHHTHPDGTPYAASQCPIRGTWETGVPCRVDQDMFWRKDGTSFPVGYSAYPVIDEGRIAGAVVTFADVTERRALEAQLRQAQKLEAIGQLTGGVAHDFNNLLTAVLGYCELLSEDLAPGDPRAEDVEQIRKAGQSGAALTRQLLAFSRQQVLRPQVLDLNAVVTSTENLLRRVIGEDVTLSVVLEPELWAVHVDPHQLEQVMLNLAVNARDAMPDGGLLTIETTNVEAAGDDRPGHFVALKIGDTGTGMSDEVRRRIFEPFFTTKAPGRGTGLGLSTVLGIVEQSGGWIDVDSASGGGSIFTIYLPASEAQPEPVRPAAVAKAKAANNEVVLLVDDEAAIRVLVRTVLERAGYQVRTASSPAEALEMEADAHTDLLITDIVMPAMDGKQLAGALRGRCPGLRVLYISGYTGTSMLHRRGLEQDEAFLEKPFTPSALTLKVQEVLNAG